MTGAIPMDRRVALRAATLKDRFDGAPGTETIERILFQSYDKFADNAAIPNWLPLLAERCARQRPTSLARVEGKGDDSRPVVLLLDEIPLPAA